MTVNGVEIPPPSTGTQYLEPNPDIPGRDIEEIALDGSGLPNMTIEEMLRAGWRISYSKM